VRRRTPSWFVETTAWSAAVVLLAGAAVAFSGTVSSTVVPAASAAETPVVAVPTPTASPAPKAGTRVVTRNRAPQLSVEQILGPPPGPQVDQVPTAFAPAEQRFAFLFGVTDYRSPTTDTIGSANDVRFIRAALIQAGWFPENIRVVVNAKATGAAARDGLRWLASKSVPGTFTFFHYSGHVKQEGGREKLWPVDRDFVTDTQVASILNRGTGKLWVDIAGCEAGGFIEDLPSSRVLVTASSKVTEKSYEYPDWRESVWTGLLFDLGLSQGQADADRNGTTTVGEAIRYATYYAQAITLYQRPYGRQTPQRKGFDVLGWTLANPPA
jgi:hypothetical protein